MIPSGFNLQESADSRRSVETSDGVRLAYWRSPGSRPDAPALLLLHGAASNHTRWSELVERTELTQRWRLLRPDLRGNGQSLWRGRLDLAVWSRDLATILRAEALAEAVLVGHSLGAQIALDFAARYREKSRGLILLDPVFADSLTGKRRRLYRWRPLLRLVVALLRAVNALGLRRRSFPDRDLRELDRETRRALAGADSFDEIARRYSALGPILRHMPTANYLQQLLATVAPVPDLEALHCPVLVLLSGGVSFADPETTRRRIDRLPDADVVVIDANHWPLTEKPDEVRRAIEEWVDRRWPAG